MENFEIKIDGDDVVVTDGKAEYFRKPKTKQTISIANDIYFAIKYSEQGKKERHCIWKD